MKFEKTRIIRKGLFIRTARFLINIIYLDPVNRNLRSLRVILLNLDTSGQTEDTIKCIYS